MPKPNDDRLYFAQMLDVACKAVRNASGLTRSGAVPWAEERQVLVPLGPP